MNVIVDESWRDVAIDDDVYIGDIRTSTEAHNARLNLLEQCARIRSQLEADVEGNHRGNNWRRRAKTALSFKSIAIQRLQIMAAALAKQERIAESETRNERLIKAMRNYIGEERFFAIVAQIDAEKDAA